MSGNPGFNLVLILALAGVCLLPSCAIRGRVHPTVEIQTPGGTELGVSTTDGILFLGTTATEGNATARLLFGDIPYQESGAILPAGGGFYRLELDVRHRGVLIANRWPAPDEELVLMGLKDGKVWRTTTTLANRPDIHGEVYHLPAGVDLDAAQAGAGLFRRERGGHLTLVGLVKGIATLKEEGSRWLCVAGLEDLRRCMETRRRLMPERRLIHRPDLSRPIIRE